jgi:hypothetical protein
MRIEGNYQQFDLNQVFNLLGQASANMQPSGSQASTSNVDPNEQILGLLQGLIGQINQARGGNQAAPVASPIPLPSNTFPFGIPGMAYGSGKAGEVELLTAPDEEYAQKKFIAGYIPTSAKAGELKAAGVANMFSPDWLAEVQDAVKRNGGLGSDEEGYLAWSNVGFVRLKNENLTPEQNKKLAEMSLVTGTPIENTPAQTQDSSSAQNVNDWVNTFISRHDNELAAFIQNPADGYSVSDGRKKYHMEFNQEAGAVVSYQFKKSGGIRGFVQKHMKYIKPILDTVGKIAGRLPGWGQIVAIGAKALDAITTTIAYGKEGLSNALKSIGSMFFSPAGKV